MQDDNSLLAFCCKYRDLIRVPKTSKTSTASHHLYQKGFGRLFIGDNVPECLFKHVAQTIEKGKAYRLSEFLTTRFPFFIEINAYQLFPRQAPADTQKQISRESLGMLIAEVVKSFGVEASAILVVGWDGNVQTQKGFRLRYIFEDVIVDRERAYRMYSHILHRAFRMEMRGLVDAYEVSPFAPLWQEALPHDPYAETVDGDKARLMVGSVGMEKCKSCSGVYCPYCLGRGYVMTSTEKKPLSLLEILDSDGNICLTDTSKLTTLEIVQRTSLRTNRPLTAGWALPFEPMATPIVKGALVKYLNDESLLRKQNKHVVNDDSEEKRRAVTGIIHRHDGGVYAKTTVDKLQRMGSGDTRWYRAFIIGPNDGKCPNYGGCHMDYRIHFVINAKGAKVVCNCKSSEAREKNKPECSNFKQDETKHKLTRDEKMTLQLQGPSSNIGYGPTSHVMPELLRKLRDELNGREVENPKKKKTRR